MHIRVRWRVSCVRVVKKDADVDSILSVVVRCGGGVAVKARMITKSITKPDER